MDRSDALLPRCERERPRRGLEWILNFPEHRVWPKAARKSVSWRDRRLYESEQKFTLPE
jgi:hypothetical protein